MATILPYRQPVSVTNYISSTGLDRKASLSSFPSSRTPSSASMRNGSSHKAISGRIRRNDSDGSTRTPPTPSSHSNPTNAVALRSPRKVKPQYPADSPEKHVEYILVASFDIDRGPTMEHQYPGAISGDENMLAELMLPDQAHVRNQDWTIFFLHKDTGDEEEIAEAKRLRRDKIDRRKRRKAEGARGVVEDGMLQEVSENEEEQADEEDEEDEVEVEGGEGPPLIYVLNLVNTKQDTTAKRGAVVKAMAICTRHSFLHIYKPLLLLALEEYFKSPYPDTLASLFDAVNAMDLSLMPRLSTLERHILQASDTKDLFVEKFEQMIQQRMAQESPSDSATSLDSPSKKAGDMTRPSNRYGIPRDTHEYETRVVYNSIPIPIKIPTAVSPETVGDFSVVKLIQVFSGPHATSPQPFAMHPHLTTSGSYTHPIIVLVNAILTQKRIIFLGHNRPSGEVAEAVLAACALVSGGVLRGFTRHAFPYTDLTKIDDLLKVPGFIAGVTNPAFANHPEWWDLLCDIPTGRMKISNRIDQAPLTEGFIYFQQQNPTYAPNSSGIGGGPSLVNGSVDPTGDQTFIDDVLRSIASRHGESVIRSKWRDYIVKFTRIAAAFEEAVYGASALYIGASEADAGAYGVSGHGYVWPDEISRGRELGANVWRIEGWRLTRSYYSFIQDLAALWGRLPIRKLDLGHQLDRLRQLRLSHEESGKLFLAMRDAIGSYDEVCQLLTATPENHAGLFYLSLGFFHPDASVRKATVELIERIKEHEAGRHFYAQLGRFAKCAFLRIKKEGETTGKRETGGDTIDTRPRTALRRS
ncbi:hypothetical protein MMC34_003949 [Xylographa carneopallida]|nr:hypothetical protein [Xylographa carneopallida]